jgi:eukaryotic-like serine/threonine-protein kinase
VASPATPFGRYLIIRPLGSGDRVSLAGAATPAGEQACVIKQPPAERRDEPEYLARFRRAAHLSRRLAHDGLVAVHDVGEVAGQPYVVEEFVEGHDLAAVMHRCAAEKRPIPVIAALHIACEVARALGFLHEFEGLHLVHRKVRPGKIRITYAGGAKLLDLASGRVAGAEASLRPAALVEILPYLAPEQLVDGPIDGRADIYALGVVLWECLAGCPLFSTLEGGQAGLMGASREQIIERIRAHRPPPPSHFNPEVRADMDAVVMRALARVPDERPALAADLERALLPMAGDLGRDAVARLMSRLFDASREREEQALLLAAAAGQRAAQPGPREASAGLSGSSEADLREIKTPGPGRTQAPVSREPSSVGAPTGSALSVTTLVSRNTRWLRRFAVIFGPALVAAIAFNIYMTKRLDAEAAAASSPMPIPVSPSPRPAQEQPTRPAEPPPVEVVAAAPASKRTTALATSMATVTRVSAEAPALRRPAVASGAGKKLLEEARAAFGRDDFTQAIKMGRAALAAGEGGAHDLLGSAYFKLDRCGDAVREYSEALYLDPHNPSLAKRLEIARRCAGHRAEGASP